MKTYILFIVILLLNSSLLFSQVAINTDGSAPDSSTMLDVKSTNRGVLIPRMNVDERNAIISPADGLLVFCTNCGTEGALSVYSNGTWRTFSPCLYSAAPTAGVHKYSPGQITWKWSAVSGATGYRWSITNNYSSAEEIGTAVSRTENGIPCDTEFSRYVWSYNICSASPATTLNAIIPAAAPDAPAAGPHVPAYNQIIWKWDMVAGASGYKWNTANDLASALDMDTSTAKIETGLAINTSYTRYVWAYNGCGYSIPLEIISPTIYICGSDDLTINHVADTVAPVSKTVTYGTATNIPGEASKCWITSNLGASRQATAKNDTTEASAGWYWQFNRMRGYRYGASRTPNSTWITTINENSNWISGNDPCALEMGNGWRLPTQAEWTNVDAGGSWTNWDGPWNSALKLHASGYLLSGSGGLSGRGNYGFYWSGNQVNNNLSYSLYFESSGSYLTAFEKPFGFSVRCINCMNPSPPVEGTHSAHALEITWTWDTVPGATGYKWNLTNDYNTAINMGSSTHKIETGIPCETASYTRYLWAYSACGVSPVTVLNHSTQAASPIDAPVPGLQVPAYNQIVWDWDTVEGANGYKWNTTNNVASAIDMDTCTSKTETGLAFNTTFTRYIWAYNDCYYSEPVSLSATTVFNCGSDSITVSHIAGTVAPVTKTVTYGTVNNIPGEPSKCWITSNLGASHQAYSITDTTEASAGWYWQFNRKQGYKHTGLTRTPNTTWITSINENSDWVAAQDPCALQLGNGWRLPTSTEWTQVTGSNDLLPISALKLHAAGCIYNGSLSYRGNNGLYWSSSQSSNSYGYIMVQGGYNLDMYSDAKIYGFSIRCLTCSNPLPPGEGSHIGSPGQVTWNWNSVAGVTGYKWNATSNYTTAIDRGTNSSYTETGLECDTSYTRYVWAYSSCGTSPVTELSITRPGSGPAGPPAAGTHVPSISRVTWEWDTVSGASGYRWNTTNNIATSIDMDTNTVKVETGLASNTSYTRYAWAYNGCGYSELLAMTATTLAFACGDSLTVEHMAGSGVAPVDKTVTYGTVTNIPGAPSLCWITGNLGADHQALAVSDTTEASAGWYWQFNRKQGYKHSGLTRTPNTAWITNIYESSNWAASNDPCTLELGDGWRVPIINEWSGVDAGGSWTDWNGPWSSDLKLHAAGSLDNTNASLVNRGSVGQYWSSSLFNMDNGGSLSFSNSISNTPAKNIASGMSIRCVKCVIPATPAAGTHVPFASQVVWNWNAVTGAAGYKWNTTNNYSTATNMDTATTKTETGLIYETAYTRYVWAYNSCGSSTPVTLTASTLTFTCGTTSITKNHTAGTIAPVSKIVTYGTVTDIPGEPSKCWITRNLGADQQATAVNDATELSAGWYWQFNRAQGYKHDGTTRTPNTTWITSIDENSDWLPANDPCSLELGNNWRVPTNVEWTNVNAGGSWIDWNGPWDSPLRIHAAGRIANDGIFNYRGVYGNYWSSNQSDNTNGAHLHSNASSSGVDNQPKTRGESIRCIHNCFTSPSTPAAGTHVPSLTQIVWNWNTVSGATGYKWSATNDFASAAEMGTSTTKTETGLTYGTEYTRYAWAYNECGNSTPVTLVASTLSFTCGTTTIPITHVAGNVAPVNKTVTYGTVTNIPGEASKCWITRNLGADQQATAKNDATEPSGGWYWQFNRMQGYKGNGSSAPTPAWNTTPINQGSDWSGVNDPCTIEMGNNWRIPTNTEWVNVYTTGSWTNWDGPWNSALNMHASGHLDLNNGYTIDRGNYGSYWSSTQSNNSNAYLLDFHNTFCHTNPNSKTYGFAVRCIHDCFTSPSTPAAGTHVPSLTQIVWNWNAVSGASGYRWSATNDFASATEMGTSVTKTETGLAYGTAYTRYAWAYNECGNSTPVTLNATTLPFTCGSTSITKNHTAGTVAPVNKTVTYGTVTNIPGETSKCWITSNLGADHQATSGYDNTEASAGWYWQFNRMQGYKHDGTTRTPATTWITSINDDSDWQTENDPCSIELGGGWRLPISTEWSNANTAGNWNSLSWGPWSTPLKMHAAGELVGSNGNLTSRGTYGKYYSRTQNGNTNGVLLVFGASFSGMAADPKQYAYSARCIRE
jgi:hypothetical protein